MRIALILTITQCFFISFSSFSQEIDYDRVLFKSHTGEYHFSTNGGKDWTHLRYTENNYDKQIFITKDGDKYTSNDKGKTWQAEKTTQVEVLKNDNKIIAYPNPADNRISFRCGLNSESAVKIHVINSNGETVFTNDDARVNSDGLISLNTENYTKGIYFITIFSNENEYTVKFIVSK